MDSEQIDYLRMASVVVHTFFKGLPANMVEDAISEAAMAGWRAAQRHDPEHEGAMSLKGWVWVKMQCAVKDWLRSLYGRHHHKLAVNTPLSLHEDQTDGDECILLDLLHDEQADGDLAAVEARMTVRSLVFAAGLNEKERYVVAGVLQDRTLLEIGRGLGVTEGRACQIKKQAARKMREVASAA